MLARKKSQAPRVLHVPIPTNKTVRGILLCYFLAFATLSYSQEILIEDTKNDSIVNEIKEGDQVWFKSDRFFGHNGRVGKIGTDSFLVDDQKIAFDQLKMLGKRKKGTGTKGLIASALGGFLFGYYSLGPNNPGWLRAGGVIGLLTGFRISTVLNKRHRVFKLKKQYTVKVLP